MRLRFGRWSVALHVTNSRSLGERIRAYAATPWNCPNCGEAIPLRAMGDHMDFFCKKTAARREQRALLAAVADAPLDHHAVQSVGLEREGWDPPAAA